jgi:hypothetical protein
MLVRLWTLDAGQGQQHGYWLLLSVVASHVLQFEGVIAGVAPGLGPGLQLLVDLGGRKAHLAY